MKLQEIEWSFHRYCFRFQLVQWGKYTVFVENAASEISTPVIRRYLRIRKWENWSELKKKKFEYLPVGDPMVLSYELWDMWCIGSAFPDGTTDRPIVREPFGSVWYIICSTGKQTDPFNFFFFSDLQWFVNGQCLCPSQRNGEREKKKGKRLTFPPLFAYRIILGVTVNTVRSAVLSSGISLPTRTFCSGLFAKCTLTTHQ